MVIIDHLSREPYVERSIDSFFLMDSRDLSSALLLLSYSGADACLFEKAAGCGERC